MDAQASDTPFISNQEVARILFQMAALLDTMQCNPFRIRAYRRAALGVLFLPRPLVDYFNGDQEAPLPGVGERMRKHLGDLVNTGTFDTHDALRDEVGEPLISLLGVQGVGPKTAIRLMSELQVSTVQEVAEAARAGKIQGLRGFGPVREARIAEAAEALLTEAA